MTNNYKLINRIIGICMLFIPLYGIADKHHDVKEDVVKTSKKVKSMSYCDKCHQKADEGRFDF